MTKPVRRTEVTIRRKNPAVFLWPRPRGDDYEEWQLGYVQDDRVVIAATATYDKGTTDFVLRGFIPTPVDGLFLSGTERGGTASMICVWGTDRMDRAMKAAGLD